MHQNIPRFRTVFPTAEVEIHSVTAAELAIEDRDRVRIISEVGAIEVEAKIVQGDETLPHVLELYHGWQDALPNLLTDDLRNDPISGFPVLKAVPVRIGTLRAESDE